FLSGSHDARSYRCRRMRRPRGPSGLRRTNLADDKAQVPLAPRLTSAESEQLAARSGLVEMGVRPPLGRYAAQVWQRRSFIWNLSASRAYSRNQGSYLGQAWAVLRPILDAGEYVIIFGFLLHSSAPGIDTRRCPLTRRHLPRPLPLPRARHRHPCGVHRHRDVHVLAVPDLGHVEAELDTGQSAADPVPQVPARGRAAVDGDDRDGHVRPDPGGDD